MVDGQNLPPRSSAAPHSGGPLGSSGAAPEDRPAATQSVPEEAATSERAAVDKPVDNAVDKPASGMRAADSDPKPPAAAQDDSAVGSTATSDEPASGSEETKSKSTSTTTDTPGKEPGSQPADANGMAAPSVTALALAPRGEEPGGPHRRTPMEFASHSTEWARRPLGRVVLPAVVAVLLLAAAGTAGAYLVPQALSSSPEPSATPAFGGDAGVSTSASAAPIAPVPSLSGIPLPSVTSAPTVSGTLPPVASTQNGTATGTRPVDALSGWAQQVGPKVGISDVAMKAYGYAEMVVARTTPSCRLSWTTVAAIASVESSHGTHNGSVLGADGTVTPPIYGLPLDGKGGRQLITDTDQALLDRDPTYDRAVGPLQFIPATWQGIAVGSTVDADGNGVSDPQNINDAALAAAVYLCQGGRDLSRPDSWWEAILSYNDVRPYAQKVYETANDYGVRSRS